ncbi:hypothetical protein EVAR_16658_1 [Eumeta japonica]|uniref:Uncharacterized protein n=1 Tax=Eumeta variegata TaxID=151549 RepID=A0A4C1UZF4_EUMVA|nr:hypothetical protein EVAR_16658_1 [Eumeta japonica]
MLNGAPPGTFGGANITGWSKESFSKPPPRKTTKRGKKPEKTRILADTPEKKKEILFDFTERRHRSNYDSVLCSEVIGHVCPSERETELRPRRVRGRNESDTGVRSGRVHPHVKVNVTCLGEHVEPRRRRRLLGAPDPRRAGVGGLRSESFEPE